ncbi:hypothetical protein J6590_068028 [Homalodisca vitripennis]|nr:hypothetical protein J6590_068028 [Homalodisca vitripennis]
MLDSESPIPKPVLQPGPVSILENGSNLPPETGFAGRERFANNAWDRVLEGILISRDKSNAGQSISPDSSLYRRHSPQSQGVISVEKVDPDTRRYRKAVQVSVAHP